MIRPEDIEKKVFTVVHLRNGYSQNEVDDYLDEVILSYRAVLAELDGFRRADTAVIPMAVPEQITQASRLLELSQQAVADEKAAAEEEAKKVLYEARLEGQKIVQGAKAEATRLLEEATQAKHAEVGRLEDQRQVLQNSLEILEGHRKRVAERLAAALREVSDEASNET
jgi:DivIVA domain-containing protein